MSPEFLRVLRILSTPCAGLWVSRLVSRLGASCHLSSVSHSTEKARWASGMRWGRHSLFTAPGRRSPASCTAGATCERFLGSGTERSRAVPRCPWAALPRPRPQGLGRRLRCFPPGHCGPSRLTFLTLGSKSTQHVCYLSSAWWAPARFMSGCGCALGVMKSLLSFAGYLFK